MQAVIEQPGSIDEAVAAPSARELLDPAEISRVILPSKTLSAVERVGVYQGMYLLRMVEALENDFPAVAHFLGSDEFADLVTRYVKAHPSQSYTLNRLGDALPDFVRSTRGIRQKGFVADLARLELLMTEVFDAPESPAWPAEEVGRLPEEAWERAVLRPIAALRLGAFSHRVNAYLQSVKDDDHDHPASGRSASWIVVFRKDYQVFRLDLDEVQYRFLSELVNGRPFGKAVARACSGGGGAPSGERISRWLRDWVAEGMFSGLTLPSPG
jgi:hypothetical protein